MMSDSMNHLQASHAAEVDRLQSKVQDVSNLLRQSREKASALATELLSAQENSRDLVDSVSKLQNRKLDSASAEYALDKKKLVEDISTLKITNSNTVADLQRKRKPFAEDLPKLMKLNEELNTKIVNIDATLKQEKTAREQSEFASKTYHQQIQARGHMVEKNNLKEKDNRIMELENDC